MAANDKAPQPSRRAGQRQRSGRATSGQQAARTARTATVELPFVTAEFRIPELRMPDVTQLPVAGVSRDDVDGAVALVRSYLPPPQQAAYYVCLGVLGALQMLEWPVVLAIGAGTAISRQGGSAQQGGSGT
jgi:predicted component of type VI protein secretion system